jgi:hypothetical protein
MLQSHCLLQDPLRFQHLPALSQVYAVGIVPASSSLYLTEELLAGAPSPLVDIHQNALHMFGNGFLGLGLGKWDGIYYSFHLPLAAHYLLLAGPY